MHALIDSQPGVEDDRRHRKDHRIESHLLDGEMSRMANPGSGKHHARHRKHQVYGHLGNGLPMKPMIEYLDHDRLLASTNLKTSRW
jgi:hypothetical protein